MASNEPSQCGGQAFAAHRNWLDIAYSDTMTDLTSV